MKLYLFLTAVSVLTFGCIADGPDVSEVAAVEEQVLEPAAPKPIPETDPDYAVNDAYTELRNQALQFKSEDQIAVTPPEAGEPATEEKVIALLIENGAADAVETLFVANDGTVAVYFSDQGDAITATNDARTKEMVDQLLGFSQEFLDKTTPTETYPLPHQSVTRFYLITNNGVHAAGNYDDDLMYERSPFAHLKYGSMQLKSEILR